MRQRQFYIWYKHYIVPGDISILLSYASHDVPIRVQDFLCFLFLYYYIYVYECAYVSVNNDPKLESHDMIYQQLPR